MKRVTDLSSSLYNIKTTDFEACDPSLVMHYQFNTFYQFREVVTLSVLPLWIGKFLRPY